MTLTDEEGNLISERDAIKTGLAIIDGVKADDGSDFSRGILLLRAMVAAKKRGGASP